MVEKTKKYAIGCHRMTNHLYGDGVPYEVHLEMVHKIGLEFQHLLSEKRQEDILAALWCHDTIEDTRQTYNDVKLATNTYIADLTYAVTNLKGRSRAERAGIEYYSGISSIPGATFVKLCDRIANVEYSKEVGSRQLEMYKSEQSNFKLFLYRIDYEEMFDYLDDLLNIKE